MAEPAFHRCIRASTARGTASRGTQRLQELLRIDIGNDRAGADRRAILEHDAGRAAALDDDLAHRRADVDADAVLLGRARHRLGDRAHAADSVAPHAGLAVHLAEHVMQQYVAAARRVGAGKISHDRVEAEQSLDRIGVEPAVQYVTGRSAEQAPCRLEAAVPPQLFPDRRDLAEIAHALSDIPKHQIGRCVEHDATQDGGHAADLGLIGRITRGVRDAEFRDLTFRAPVGGDEIAPVR